jgi:hypothetical protein
VLNVHLVAHVLPSGGGELDSPVHGGMRKRADHPVTKASLNLPACIFLRGIVSTHLVNLDHGEKEHMHLCQGGKRSHPLRMQVAKPSYMDGNGF